MEHQRRTPSMEDAGELAGIEVLHPGGFDLSKRIGAVVNMTDKKVLEVACGRGTFACYFAKHFGARVTGIDLNTDLITASVNRARSEGVADSTEFKVADASHLPLTESSFDVVVSECGPVGLAPDPQTVVNEMVRVMKPGSYLVLHAPVWLKEVPDGVRRDIEYRLGGRMFTLSEWDDMLRRAGLVEKRDEDWSSPEQISKMRPGRKIRILGDVFTLRERLLVVLRVLRRYGCKGLLYHNESFKKVSPLFYDRTIGTYLMRSRKPDVHLSSS